MQTWWQCLWYQDTSTRGQDGVQHTGDHAGPAHASQLGNRLYSKQ